MKSSNRQFKTSFRKDFLAKFYPQYTRAQMSVPFPEPRLVYHCFQSSDNWADFGSGVQIAGRQNKIIALPELWMCSYVILEGELVILVPDLFLIDVAQDELVWSKSITVGGHTRHACGTVKSLSRYTPYTPYTTKTLGILGQKMHTKR